MLLILIMVKNSLKHSTTQSLSPEQLALLLEISTAITKSQTWVELLSVIREKLTVLIPFYDASILVVDPDGLHHYDMALAIPGGNPPGGNLQLQEQELLRIPHPGSYVEFVMQEAERNGRPIVEDYAVRIKQFDYYFFPALQQAGIVEGLVTTLQSNGKAYGSFWLNSIQKGAYSQVQFALFEAIAKQVSVAVANIVINEELMERNREKEQLFQISEAIATVHNSKQLLRVVYEHIKPVFDYDNAGLFILDKDCRNYYEWTDFAVLPDEVQKQIEEQNLLGPFPVDSFKEESWFNVKEPTVTTVEQEMNWVSPQYAGQYEIGLAHGLKEAIGGPLNFRGRKIGVLCFNTRKENFYNKRHKRLFRSISNIVAAAVANIRANEEILQREQEKDLLLNVTQKLSRIKKADELLQIIVAEVKPIFNFYDTGILVINKETKTYQDLSVLYPHIDGSEENYFLNSKGYYKHQHQKLEGSIVEWILHQLNLQTVPLVFDLKANYAAFTDAMLLQDIGSRLPSRGWMCPLIQGGLTFGILSLNYETENDIPFQKTSLLLAMADRIAANLSTILANQELENRAREIANLNQQLKAQNEYLLEEIEQQYNFEEMIGQNQRFAEVCKNIGLVARTDTTVLVLGETGTGKELVARAIHNNSPRKSKPLIKLNCAALPANLIESELFGHERGAFTGAVERRVGKFELANGSTLFLDEVGELPLELQAKLLRALQEKEIERLGSNKTMRIDVRIIAATNRDLEQEVQAGKFRQDLYYRLHIFPITLPPLRERKEDIPLLAVHFLERYGKKTGKKIGGFSSQVMQEMMSYNWPGNIRELEHVIERSVITSDTRLVQKLNLPDASKKKTATAAHEFVLKTWQEQERDYILQVLKLTNGNVKGKGGAAELLRLPPSTLQAKMKKLGIVRKHYVESKEDI